MTAKAHLRDILDAVLVEFPHLDRATVLSPARHRHVARPRQIAMALSMELGRKSLPEVGRFYGGKDHTTVLHAVRAVMAHCQIDPEFAATVSAIRGRVLASMVAGGSGAPGFRERIRQAVLADPDLKAAADRAAEKANPRESNHEQSL